MNALVAGGKLDTAMTDSPTADIDKPDVAEPVDEEVSAQKQIEEKERRLTGG
jgi:hypothetical protein